MREARGVHRQGVRGLYDCFGDFEGFVLSSCEEERRFRACEPAVGELVLKVCRERLRLTVHTEDHRVKKLIVRKA